MRLLSYVILTTLIFVLTARNIFNFSRPGRMAHLMTVHINNKEAKIICVTSCAKFK